MIVSKNIVLIKIWHIWSRMMITNVSSTVPYAFLVLLVGIGDEGSGKYLPITFRIARNFDVISPFFK